MRLGIIGGGCVGRATARAFIEHVDEVRVYDVVKERRTHDVVDVFACDLIFVCLPTPQKDGGRGCDLSAIEGFFGVLGGKLPKTANLVLRSTVPVGTTRRLKEQYGLPNLVHSPEFLTARCAVTDAQLPARNVIGYPGEIPCFTDCPLAGLYARRFPGVPIHALTSDESESVKLIQNSLFAVTVAYWNEVYGFAKAAGLDWGRVQAAVLADGRISHSHTRVPGPDGHFGYGGSCLPGWYSVDVDGYTRMTLPVLKRWFDSGYRPRIRSTDGDCRNVDYKRVLAVTEREYDGDLIVFETDAGEFACTPEHLMPVLRGGTLVIVQAQDILDTDELLVDDELHQGNLSSVRKEEAGAV